MRNTYITKIQRVGSSSGVVIPRVVMKAQGIERGDRAIFAVYGERQFCFRILTDKELQELQPKQIII